MNDLLFKNRRWLILPLDVALAATALYASYSLRFDSIYPQNWGKSFLGWPDFLLLTGIYVASQIAALIFTGTYRSLWAYASLNDIIQILKGVFLGNIAAIIVVIFFGLHISIPRSIFVLNTLFLFFLVSMRSFSWRLLSNVFRNWLKAGKRSLIIGTGPAGDRLARELQEGDMGYKLVAFIATTAKHLGSSIHGVPVSGSLQQLAKVIDDYHVEQIFISERLSREQIRSTYRISKIKGVNCKTMPQLISPLKDEASISQALREISIEDLLGRKSVYIRTDEIGAALKNCHLLVTGAGGSIGSEVCYQLARYPLASLTLLDIAETPLYEIDHKLRLAYPNIKIATVIGDIRHRETLRTLLSRNEIDTIFHCAAYKHVPLMEINPTEAIFNNVIATMQLADLAKDNAVKRFVLVSTDKVVNPTSIMGASKKIAELYIQNLGRISHDSKSRFITVRFGNVLGSNGSVVPLFLKQIAQGGPVTVTHPDIVRFFMTIREAAGLLIQAGIMGEREEIFTLDMGEPVKIKDLAEDMIAFSGLAPHKDIQISFTGLRPGEKLFEEIALAEENIQPTNHEKIYIAQGRFVGLEQLKREIEKLQEAGKSGDRQLINTAIKEIIPEYSPPVELSAV